MAATTTFLCSRSPSATPPPYISLPPSPVISPRPNSWLDEFRFGVLRPSSRQHLQCVCGSCDVHHGAKVVLGIWTAIRHDRREEYVLPLLRILFRAINAYKAYTFRCSWIPTCTHNETVICFKRSISSKAWWRIKQAGHNMLFLVPHNCIYFQWMQQVCRQIEPLVHVLLPESQMW